VQTTQPLSSGPADTSGRPHADLITGLRALADWYEQHPELPAPFWPQWDHCVNHDNDEAGVTEVEQIAAVLGAPVKHGANVVAYGDVGGLRVHVFYVPQQAMRDYQARASYADVIEVDR
jgi:hypothetical protein